MSRTFSSHLREMGDRKHLHKLSHRAYNRTHLVRYAAGDTGIYLIEDHCRHIRISKGEEFGAVESVKAASDLYSPVSGTIIEINSALESEPELINQDAYENWIIKVELADPSELDSLLDAAAYEKICDQRNTI